MSGAWLAVIGRRVSPGFYSEPREEIANRRPETRNVHEEGVVALRRGQREGLGLGPAGGEALGGLCLLLEREQDVGQYTDRQRTLDPDAAEPGLHLAVAVFGEVE